LRVTLSIAFLVGRNAGVEAGILAPDLLKDEGLVADDHAVGHVLDQELALEQQKHDSKLTSRRFLIMLSIKLDFIM
jgi:hypothetical protein